MTSGLVFRQAQDRSKHRHPSAPTGARMPQGMALGEARVAVLKKTSRSINASHTGSSHPSAA